MIFLDTNILIEYLKGNKSLIETYNLSELFISDIVVMEWIGWNWFKTEDIQDQTIQI